MITVAYYVQIVLCFVGIKGGFLFSVFFLVQEPLVGQGLLIHEVSRSHTTTHHSR
jgi:hypothetical protein